MMYLPEVEIVRRELERDTVGRKVKSVKVDLAEVASRSGGADDLVANMVGAKLASLDRIGTNLVFKLDNEYLLVILLSTTTLLRRVATRDRDLPGTVMSITFTQGGQLRIIDAEGAAEVFTVSSATGLAASVPELADIGMDPLAKPISWTDFGRRVVASGSKLKTLLTDERLIEGLGDIYSDEILFEASLRYGRVGSSLNTQELRRFYRAVVAVLNDAVKYRGTTLDSSPFVDTAGEAGGFQAHLQVFGKHGELSPRSRQPLVRSKFAGRWTYYCAQSQV